LAKNRSGKPIATPNDFLIARIPKMTPQERWELVADLLATAIARWEYEPKEPTEPPKQSQDGAGAKQLKQRMTKS